MLNGSLERAHDFIKYRAKPRAHTQKTYAIQHAGLFGLPEHFLIETFAMYPFSDAKEAYYKAALRKYDREIELIRWTAAVAVYTKWLVIAGFSAAIIGVFTLIAIKGQLGEMRSGSSDTHTLAESAKNQSGYAKSTADTARDAYVADNRAFIGPTDAGLQQFIAGKGVKIQIQWKNTGRQPVSVGTGLEIRLHDEQLQNNDPVFNSIFIFDPRKSCMQRDIEPTAFAFPNGGFSQYTMTFDTSNPNNVNPFVADEALINGKKAIFVIGCMTYHTLGITRHTAFCYFYKANSTPDVLHLNLCQNGWDAD